MIWMVAADTARAIHAMRPARTCARNAVARFRSGTPSLSRRGPQDHLRQPYRLGDVQAGFCYPNKRGPYQCRLTFELSMIMSSIHVTAFCLPG